ncbi:MAG: GntR family transcriptional regulator [Firmicutes bacterium]|nr:GntR family transcriptional regulator [Bacillota bacterium]
MFNIDIRSNVPIYEQLVGQVKRAVVQGLLKKGDLIPSVRKMAAELGVNPNTVAKAYQELEHQGVTITVRGRGTMINDLPARTDISGTLEKMRPLITELIYAGKSKDEIIAEIGSVYDEIRRDS